MPPRCLNKEAAAEYCGLTPTGFDAWVRRGIIPGPIRRTRRWDRKALDAALDKASELVPESMSRVDAADEALRGWLANEDNA